MSRYTDEEIATIRQRMIDGEMCVTLAKEYGCSRQYMTDIKHNLCRKGIGPDASKSRSTQAENRTRALELRRKGYTIDQVAEMLGLAYHTVSTYTLHQTEPDWKHKDFKTTSEQRAIIRRMYESGEYTQAELGKYFGLAQRTISEIVHPTRKRRGEDDVHQSA